MSVDRDTDQPLPHEAWRHTFQTQARRTRKRHEIVGCLGLVVVFGLFSSLLLLSDPDRVPWYWAFFAGGAGIVLMVWLRPAPWPKCPACSGTFRRLGTYCPHCGSEFPDGSTPKRADCSACGRRMTIVSKAPQYQQERHTSADYRFRLVPIHYCTHCRARL